jgi:hypothetical protein
MTLLKRIDRASVLIPYEQLFIQAYHQRGHLIAEQYMDEQNPLYQLAIDSSRHPERYGPIITPPTVHVNQFHPGQASSR